MTTQLRLPSLPEKTPEQQVAEILRSARARFGNNLKPFYDELLLKRPKVRADDYRDLVAIARQKREMAGVPSER
jgi:hypothetical protein